MRYLGCLCVVLALPASLPAQVPGLRVSPGFEVTEFADARLANDIYCMTIDPKGRVVVAGRGYIRLLVDDNGDGRADRAISFAAEPKDGAMGLHWEGTTLYVTGDGGLRRLTDQDGNDRADGPSERIRTLKTGGEHAAHAIRRGPDGWLYVLCGNNTGIDAKYAETPTSPIRAPIAGCVLRFAPDLKTCEIVADGFRNAYGMDFNLDGELFAYDSDNERCVSLPWYEPTRLYHVVAGRHYGWLSPQQMAFWRRPPYFPDIMPPVATLGRGSPTGVVCYRHTQFPAKYRGGLFLLDWTFGRVLFVPLRRAGASYAGTPEPFLHSTGDHGFAPTAAAVHPKTGDLYVSIGGRGTRGGVYRVRWAKRAPSEPAPTPLLVARRPLDGTAKDDQRLHTQATTGTMADRLAALQRLYRHAERGELRWLEDAARRNLQGDDRAVRLAAADLLRALDRHGRLRLDDRSPFVASFAEGLACLERQPARARRHALALWRDSETAAGRRAGLRLLQLTLGDLGERSVRGTIWEGYTATRTVSDPPLAQQLAAAFPTADHDLNRELARTLAMLAPDDAGLRQRLLDRVGARSDPIEDVHYLAVFARIGGSRTKAETERIVAALLALEGKMVARRLNRDSNWPLRIQELYAGLAAKDQGLHAALLGHAAFGRPEHALFAQAPGFPRAQAARVFFERFRRDKASTLTPAVIRLLELLPADQTVPVLRERWGETGQEAALLPLLARLPVPADRARLVGGLGHPEPRTVRACVDGLTRLGRQADAAEIVALIQALQRCPEKDAKLRTSLAARLGAVTMQRHGSDVTRWIAWVGKAHPEQAARLTNPDGVDVARWHKRLAQIDWPRGDAQRGGAVFRKASCVNCHSGGQALGPDLTGAAARFARADLLAAIVQPSRDVPARYQTTIVETNDGKVYQGLVIYDATDSLILQTGTGATVRLDGRAVVRRGRSAQSLMPAGLLDPLSDREIADLYAYLRGLNRP